MLDGILVLLLPQGLRFFVRCVPLTPLPFYRGLLSAWVAAGGSFLATRESLVVGSFSCEPPIAVAEATTKSVYSFLVANHSTVPCCVRHFAPALWGFVVAFYIGLAVLVPSPPPCD